MPSGGTLSAGNEISLKRQLGFPVFFPVLCLLPKTRTSFKMFSQITFQIKHASSAAVLPDKKIQESAVFGGKVADDIFFSISSEVDLKKEKDCLRRCKHVKKFCASLE